MGRPKAAILHTMQCVNCQFENMPGLPKCVRCGSSLTLATATIDVNPPRAGKLSRVFRAGRRAKRGLKRSVRNAGEGLLDGLNSFNTEIKHEIPRYTACIPAWPQFLTGRPVLGRVFFVGYVLCLIPTLIFLGSELSTITLGAAVSFHLSSIVDVVMRSTKRGDTMYQEALPLLGSAVGFAYIPAVLFLYVFWWPVQINTTVPGFRFLDVVVTCRALGADVGDTVRYWPQSGRYNVRVRGTSIDRILAKAGSEVKWDGQALTVDGKPSPFAPLGGPPQLPISSWTVPDDSFFIVPPAQLQGERDSYFVRRFNVVSQVVWRTWPTESWGPFR